MAAGGEAMSVAGSLCLELVNSLNNWHQPTRDALTTPQDFTEWAHGAGHPMDTPPDKGSVARARRLRGSVRAVFLAVADGSPPPEADLRVLRTALATSLPHAAFVDTEVGYDLGWTEQTADALLGRVAWSAVTLLRTGPLDRVRECPSCGWLFLDTSRNGRRRWCSMDTCGSRDKARRYYQRRSSGDDS
jgi:predicted RNA-binding Zn ribbon-like protein